MADLNITSPDGLIQTTIKAKQEIYFLVTEDNLNSLRQKSFLTDLFMLLASLAWGAYFSVITTLKSIPVDLTNPLNSHVNRLPLENLQEIFFYAAIIFTLLAGYMTYLSFMHIRKLKRDKLEIQPNGK